MPRRGGTVKLDPSRGSPLTLILTGPPERSGGVGGWASSERALRQPAKWFKAPTDDTMSLSCLLDIDAVGGPSIERRLRVLRDMGRANGGEDPPTITVSGDIWSEDQNIRWVMSGLSLGERLWLPDGTLRRQAVTVELERYADINPVAGISVGSTRTQRKRRRRVVVARGADTLRGIALRELGDSTRWKDLQRWNKAKLKNVDPDARLRTGLHLVVR